MTWLPAHVGAGTTLIVQQQFDLCSGNTHPLSQPEKGPELALTYIELHTVTDMAAVRAYISSSSTAAATAAVARGKGPQTPPCFLNPRRSTLQYHANGLTSSGSSTVLAHATQALGLASLAISSSTSSSSSSSYCCEQHVRHLPAAAAAAAAAGASTSDTADAVSAAAATTEALLAWMQQQGCVVEGVQLQYSQGPQGQVWRELKACNVSIDWEGTVHSNCAWQQQGCSDGVMVVVVAVGVCPLSRGVCQPPPPGGCSNAGAKASKVC
jgi:hypothetical protein